MKHLISSLQAHPGNGWRIFKCDQPTVRRYARMKTEPPPIVIDSTGFILDGLHRVAAAILKGCTEIEGTQR